MFDYIDYKKEYVWFDSISHENLNENEQYILIQRFKLFNLNLQLKDFNFYYTKAFSNESL